MPSEDVIRDDSRLELENHEIESLELESQELEKSRQQSQALFEFNPNGVFIIGRDGRFTSLNPACERIMGYASDELIGRSFLDVTAPESMRQAQSAFQDALGGNTVLTRIMGYARDGSKRHLDMSIAPIAGEGGPSVLVMAHDVTQRVEAEAERDSIEAALRASEERYQVFIAQSTEAIWRYELEIPISLDLSLDEQIDLVYERAYLAECNDAMARIYGFNHASDAIGRSITELLPRTPTNEAYLREFAASGWRLNDTESSNVGEDGKTHHYISNLLGIIEDNHVVRTWGTRRDLTERKEVENKLRESQERLDLAIRSGNLGTWEWNLETGAMTCSPLARTMLGLGDDEEADFFIDTSETYRKLESTAYPADRAQVAEQCCRTAERHMPLEMEYRVVWPNGSVHWVAVEGRLVQSESEKPTRMIGTCRDITRRKRREVHQSVIAEASQQLASSLDIDTTMTGMARLLVPAHADWCVLDLLPEVPFQSDSRASGHRVAVAHTDRDKEQLLREMKSLAGGGDALFQSSGDEAQPLLISEISPAQMELLWTDPAQRALIQDAGLHSMMCVPLRARDRALGALIMVSANAERRYGDDDLALAQDLARRIALAVDNARLYGQAQQARREAEAANKAKDEFLAVVSHELRTPLTPLLGWIDLINAGRLNADQSDRAFESIGRNAHAQLQLVNDLLDVSRMISGKLPIEPVALDWREPIEAAVESIAASATQKGIALEWKQPEEAVMVAGDALRLRQVAINLLANAVKFTPTGGHIAVSLETLPSGSGQERAQLVVTDSGIGISPEFLPHVWDRFRQADASTTRSYGGLGLGLAIVRHIVEAHDGDSSVHSAGVGLGTTFCVSLPHIVAPEDELPQHEIASGESVELHRGAAVLLVDDEDDARELFTAMLRDSGWDARSVPSCELAFALLNEGEWQPVVIISDLALPGIDGYELVRRIKGSPWKELPVIALSAYARDDDRRRAMEAGFVKHLAKPATPPELNEAINSVLTKV